MTLTTIDARIRAYKPGDEDGEPYVSIPSSYIETADESQRINRFKDSGSFEIRNDGGEFAGMITSGDMLEFLVQTEGMNGLETRFTAMARNVRYHREGVRSGTIEVEAGDFVSEVLSNRRYTGVFEDEPICTSGSDEGIINRLLADKCPELDRSALPDLPTTTDIYLSEKPVKKAVDGLAAKAGATVWGEGNTVRIHRLEGLPTRFEVTAADISLPFEYDEIDDGLANFVRVDGGDDYALENEQTDVAAYETPSETNPLTFSYHTRKSETARLELWTNSHSNEGGATIRLQAPNDAGDGPVDIDDGESDIVRKQLDGNFLAEDGFTRFIMGEHTLPERDVWVIVEVDGNHEIGVNADGVPAYRQHFPYPLVIEYQDVDSIEDYRRREYSEDDENLKSRTSVIERAVDLVDDLAEPSRRVRFTAESERMHALEPGDAVRVNRPMDNISGKFAVLDRDDSFNDLTLETTVELEDVTTL